MKISKNIEKQRDIRLGALLIYFLNNGSENFSEKLKKFGVDQRVFDNNLSFLKKKDCGKIVIDTKDLSFLLISAYIAEAFDKNLTKEKRKIFNIFLNFVKNGRSTTSNSIPVPGMIRDLPDL